MELIVISSPTALKNEANLINQLFDEGLSVFHLRKLKASGLELTSLLKGIDSKYHSQISLHQHHQLSNVFNIRRIHFSEIARKEMSTNTLKEWTDRETIISTSVHTKIDFEELTVSFAYSFVGPVFDSISKIDYKASKEDFNFSGYTGTIHPIALGGISENTIQEMANKGFKGVAVLGSIWNKPENAVLNFKKLKEAIHHTHTIDRSNAE